MMPGDVLNPAELESLRHAARRQGRPASTNAATPRRGETRTRFDPQHGSGGSSGLADAMRTLNERFARAAAAGLGRLVRSSVALDWLGAEQIAYDRFLIGLQNPTCLQLLHAPPLPGHLVLELHPAIVYPLIDRLLGGGRQSGPPATRPLTQIELRLSRRIGDVLLGELRSAWADVVNLEPAVIGIETNPQHLPAVPPGDAALLVRFELTVGQARGQVNLCLTQPALTELETRLRAGNEPAAGTEALADVPLRVFLPAIRLPTDDLRGLQVGDVIATELAIDRAWLVELEGGATFTARPGKKQGRKAVRIEARLEE